MVLDTFIQDHSCSHTYLENFYRSQHPGKRNDNEKALAAEGGVQVTTHINIFSPVRKTALQSQYTTGRLYLT